MRCGPIQRSRIFIASNTYMSRSNRADECQKLPFDCSSGFDPFLPTMARLFDQTLTQVDELTKTLDSTYGTPAIPPFFTTLLQTKLELLWWCEPDFVYNVDTQIKRLHQFVEIRVRLEGKRLSQVHMVHD